MASDPLRDQLLAQFGAVGDSSPSGGLADQIAALQGLRPSAPEDEGSDFFQPVRTFFGATGGIGGQVAGAFAPEAYLKAQEEIRASRGVTDQSPWYERVEALPTAGDVAVGAMSPEFRQSGPGRVVEPITRIAGGILGDPTTYLGLGAGKLASSIAGRVAPELTAAARMAQGGREAAIAAGTLTTTAAKEARLLDAAQIAERVLSAGTPMQQRLFRLGGWVQQAEPVALAAPAALAYGPETVRSIYEQAKGIPESEHPIADAASVALLSGMTVLMGKGLMDAGRAINTWKTHAETHSLTPDVIAQGEAQITAKVQEMAPPDMPIIQGEFAYEPYNPALPTRVADAGIPSAEPIPGAPVRVGEAGIPTAEPITGVRRVATVGEAPPTPPLEAEPLPADFVEPISVRPARQKPQYVEATLVEPEPVVQVATEPPVAASVSPVTPEVPPPPAPVAPLPAPEPPPQAPPAAVLSESDRLLTEMGHPPAKGETTPVTPETSLEQQLQASIDALKQGRPAKPQQAAESAPPIKAETPPVEAPPVSEPPRAVEPPTETPPQPAALSEQETAKWGEYTTAVDTMLGKSKNKANRLLLEDAKAKAASATPEEQRQILSDIKDNYGGFSDRYVKGSKLGLDVQRGEAIEAGTERNATEPVQLGLQKPTTIAKGQEFDTARQVLKDNNITLRQFMDAPESGVLEYTENKGKGRTTTHNLKDTTTRFGKVWNRYVDLLDKGLSDSEARKTVATAEKMTENVVNNVVRAGRANTRLAVLKKYTGTEAPAAQEEARAAAAAGYKFLEKQRVTAEKAASDLGSQIEAAGGMGEDILKNAEFKTSAHNTLNELAKHLVGTRPLGARDPLRSLDALKSLAKRMGISEDEFGRNVTGEEILQKMADKAGIDIDYIGAIRGVLRPQPKPTARWAPTILSEGEVSGGKEGFTYTLRKMDDPAIVAADITNNPEMDTIVFGPDVKGPQFRQIEAALPKDIKLSAVGNTEAETLSQAYKIERPKIAEARSRVVPAWPFDTTFKAHGVDVALGDMAEAIDPGTVIRMGTETLPKAVDDIEAALKKLGVTGFDRKTFVGGRSDLRGSGSFHATFDVPGATGPNGEQYVLRVGKSPHVPLPTEEQRALMQPTLADGPAGFLEHRVEDRPVPYFWSLHQTGVVPKDIWRTDVGKADRTRKLVGHLTTAEPFEEAYHNRIQQEITDIGGLPNGLSLQEHFDASAELLDKVKQAGLRQTDMVFNTVFRHDQVVWSEVPEGTKVPDNVVTRVAIGADNEARLYRLSIADAGAIRPLNPPASSPWATIVQDAQAAIAMKQAQHVDNAPDIRISTQELAARITAYEEDLTNARKLGDSKLVLSNHDRVMSDGYLRTLQAVGERSAVALEDIHDRLVTRLLAAGRTPDGIRTRFAGLTASPHLAGLFHSTGAGEGRVFVNPVEAVNYAGTKAGAVDEMLYHLFHEVAHRESTGHGLEFKDFYQYMRNLAESEGLMPSFRKSLGEAFTDEDFARMRDELVPEFRSARSKYGTEHWRGAKDLTGVPARDLAGGTEAVPGGLGRGQEGAPGNRGAGVRPSGNVPGSGERPTGELRAGAAAAEPAAAAAAKGSAAGSPLGERLETALRRIEERAARTGKAILAREDAQTLMDELVDESKAKLGPVRDVYREGYKYATLVERHLTDTEREQLAKSLPSPRHKDQSVGIVNLLHSPDLDLRMKARIALMNDFTKGAWERDRPRKWEDVGSEVQDMLGIHTPEEWTRIYKSKGGGLLDRDVELLRTVHNELAGRLLTAEDRMFDAFNDNAPAETLNKLRDEVNFAERGFHHSMFNLSKGLTGTARALAIARHEVRNLDPILRMDQDIQAGLRERMRFKYKDVAEAEAKTLELMTKFREVREKRGSWEEFYKAYRAMLGSKLWPDKILEVYKAGLLSYPSRVANISSNALFRNVRFIEDAVAGALDAGRVGLLGGKRERYIGESTVSVLAMQRAVKEAFPDWLKAQGDAFALRPQDFHTAMAKGGLMEDMLMHPGAIEGKTGEFIRFAFKGLSSDDALSKHVSRLDTMYREIYRRVQSGEYKLNPGEKTSTAVERHFQSLKDNYDAALNGGNFDTPKLKQYQQLASVAEETALRDTFQSDLGNFGRGMNWLLRNVPALQIVFPFVRTPTNIAKETLKRTPLGFLNVARKWKDLTPGQRMTELSKPAVGSLIGAGILAQAMGGDVTGGGPVNPDELEALKATGWQPYSVKVGDSWVSYQRLEPIAAIMGIAADAAEGLRNGDFQKWQDGSMKVFSSAAENVTNKTFLSGLDGMFSAVSHPKEYLARFVKQMQGSVVPNGLGFIPLSGITRALDPVYRQTDPFSMNVFYSKLPFVSSTLEPQYGPTGEPRLRPGSAGERVISPFARTTVKTGPAAVGADEVVRLSAAPRAPGRYWTARGGVRVDFTPEERQALAKSYQEATAVIGQRLVNDPNYQRLPDNENDANYRYGMKTKADVVRRLYGKYRDGVMDRIKPRLTARAVQQVNQKGKT